MKIKRVETAYVMMKCEIPQGLSGGPMTHSTDGLCRITTSDGIHGIGLGRGAPLDQICKLIKEVFAPLLPGENALHTQYLWDKLYNEVVDASGKPKKGLEMNVVRCALCAVDGALWDIKGKAANLSICELLGGKPHPVLGYIQKGFYVDGQSLEEMAEEGLAVFQEGGFEYMKMRVGRNGIREAVERVEIMRKTLGDKAKLMVDVNQAWTLDEALEGAKALAPYNLTWMEEPISRKKGAGAVDINAEMGKFQAKSPIPLAAGENHRGLHESNELVTKAKPKYMQLDICKQSGGLSEWVKVQALCLANGVLMAPHVAPHFHVQLVAAVSNGFIIEICDNPKQHPAWPDLYIGFPKVKNGHMEIPRGAGWGLEINDDMVKKVGTAVDWDFKK